MTQERQSKVSSGRYVHCFAVSFQRPDLPYHVPRHISLQYHDHIQGSQSSSCRAQSGRLVRDPVLLPSIPTKIEEIVQLLYLNSQLIRREWHYLILGQDHPRSFQANRACDAEEVSTEKSMYPLSLSWANTVNFPPKIRVLQVPSWMYFRRAAVSSQEKRPHSYP